MSDVVEVQTRRGWRRLGGDNQPQVPETETIRLRGLQPRSPVRIGFTSLTADAAGTLAFRPLRDPDLNGHLGLVEVTVDGRLLGEIEIVASKMSQPAYDTLRADLQRTWTDLIFDVAVPTTVSARPPSSRELWSRIEAPVAGVLRQPNEHLCLSTGVRRLDRVRHRRELRPAVVRAGMQGLPALTRTLERSTATPENHLVAATLRRLRNQARREPDGAGLVHRLDDLLRHPVLAAGDEPVRRITWGMRSDRRYRQVLAVHEILNRPELAATEGPGELRLGVRALPRLYEYWTFLQVLTAARRRYGPPAAPGFDLLSRSLPGGRRRLEVAAGTTVTFPGPVHVAFEPTIEPTGGGWMGLEYVPHPLPNRSQSYATPDIAVFRTDDHPWLTIIDAKYVGRAWVERAAATTHDKYARMRLKGVPVVRNVLVVHPYEGLAQQWSGYGHLPMVPGAAVTTLPLPLPSDSTTSKAPSASRPTPDRPAVEVNPQVAAASGPSPAVPSPTASEVSNRPVAVIADQYWMRLHLAGRRIPLEALRKVVLAGRTAASCEVAMPIIGKLATFANAVERSGWQVYELSSLDRKTQIEELTNLVIERLAQHPTILVSGDPDLLDRLRGRGAEIVEDLSSVPTLSH